MATRPRIHEIFSKETQWKNKAFQTENQESIQQTKLTKKKVMAPLPPMKKFGAYVPKILAGGDDLIQVKDDISLLDKQNGITVSQGEPINNKNVLSNNSLFVTSKPWVIGDKDVPMVLGSLDDDDDINKDPMERRYNIYESVDDKENNYVNVDSIDLFSGPSNNLLNFDDSSKLRNDNVEQKHTSPFDGRPGDLSKSHDVITQTSMSSKTNGNSAENISSNEPAGVLIPPPDYDEDEVTVVFNSDDNEDSNLPPKTKIFKVYEGADFSQFLKDDEADKQEDDLQNEQKAVNNLRRQSKSTEQKILLSEKYSMFKKQNANKNKWFNRNIKAKSHTLNTVRYFSYADTKIGIKGDTDMSKALSLPNVTEDELFISANSHPSSYEEFLRSRHDKTSLRDSIGSIADFRTEEQNNRRNKEHTLWKRWTLTFKERLTRTLHI